MLQTSSRKNSGGNNDLSVGWMVNQYARKEEPEPPQDAGSRRTLFNWSRQGNHTVRHTLLRFRFMLTVGWVTPDPARLIRLRYWSFRRQMVHVLFRCVKSSASQTGSALQYSAL